jgi:hypothetical protein
LWVKEKIISKNSMKMARGVAGFGEKNAITDRTTEKIAGSVGTSVCREFAGHSSIQTIRGVL